MIDRAPLIILAPPVVYDGCSTSDFKHCSYLLEILCIIFHYVRYVYQWTTEELRTCLTFKCHSTL